MNEKAGHNAPTTVINTPQMTYKFFLPPEFKFFHMDTVDSGRFSGISPTQNTSMETKYHHSGAFSGLSAQARQFPPMPAGAWRAKVRIAGPGNRPERRIFRHGKHSSV